MVQYLDFSFWSAPLSGTWEENKGHRLSLSFFLHNPAVNGAGDGGDVHADFEEPFALLETVGNHIAPVVNLLKRCLGRAVDLEFEDID